MESKETLLGKYLCSMSPYQQSVCGIRVKSIITFLASGAELSMKGWRKFLKDHPNYISRSQRDHVLDFLNFCGICTGKTRIRKKSVKITQRLDVISEANQRKVVEFLEWVDKQREYSPASLSIKNNTMRKFFRYFNEFNNDNCRSFIKTMEAEGMHPKTLNIYIGVLRHYAEYVKKPVTLKKIAVQSSLSVENVPTVREYQSLLTWLRDNAKMETFFIVKTLGMTGMRLSELSQTKWQHIIDGEFYPRCKGKKHRMVYFPKTLIAEVKTWVKDNSINPDSLLTTNLYSGLPLSSRGLSQRLIMFAKRAGFPKEKAHCHAFRHFFAKQYLKKTKDVIQLAELLGHESVDTTRLYLQKSKAEQKRDINRNIDW